MSVENVKKFTPSPELTELLVKRSGSANREESLRRLTPNLLKLLSFRSDKVL